MIALVGDIGEGYEGVHAEGVTAVVSINAVAVPYEQARLRAPRDLATTLDNVLRLLGAAPLR